MAIHTGLYHRTTYRYNKAIKIHPQIVRLKPAPHCRTPILSYSLTVKPKDHFINWQQDAFGNYLARLVFEEPAEHLDLVVDLVADMTPINPFDFFLEEDAEEFPFDYSERALQDLEIYLRKSEDCAGVEALAKELRPTDEPRTIDFLVTVNQKVESLVKYQLRMEPGVQTCEQTLSLGSGSCRDSAFLLVQIFRALGLAARFVSGYLIQLVTDDKPLDGPEGPTEDFTDLHAWAEVYLPGAGWVGLDPTSGLFAGEGHIPLACTPEPSSAAPVEGAVDPCETTFDFENKVTRVHEDPRVTRPYSADEWQNIDALGNMVEARLEANDVRLTMGGEPTFVSIDDMEGSEWNSTADSAAKRRLAIDLTQRLRESFGPGGLIWFGEGKWYPGEPIPRWAYGVFWRKDGYPVWRNPELLCDPSEDGKSVISDAQRLLAAIAKNLKMDPSLVLPALEDVDYYRWRISTLPADEKVTEAKKKDSLERRTLARLEKRGLDVPTGYVLPMHHDERWHGAAWTLKRGDMYLIAGASAMGFRLPLDSIRKAEKKDIIGEHSPLDDSLFPPLEPNPLGSYDQDDNKEPSSKDWVPRTAVSVELREGRLHVFLPPTERTEAYLELLSSIEEAAVTESLSVVIEGYEPPADPRLESLKVTPDPGVIEVNVHPSRNWSELVDRMMTLYEDARLSRLGAEKFMLDGRHSGTGGGNHVVFGGATPADSPIWRRPDVLASLIAYWQNHPSLSYLFSGLFIGPTSQAPRVDESRDDRLFELEIALDELRGEISDPLMIDGILRHLLTDLTGNTHRAEFCIDKLAAPDSSRGQLGLVELRGFEMPPHVEMSLVQALLVRALILHFWERPYKAPLVRWGTLLHDKFMMPYHNWADVEQIGRDLQDAGLPFSAEWLKPFFEFRFPRIGSVRCGDIFMELRSALEPWHVLGEEQTSQGTARFVDSSVERIQLRIEGLIEGRHIVTCNQQRVPLYRSEINGEWIGAIRFKAWNPESALHPHIDSQVPLIISIVDILNKKSLGGCQYHVSHPGGRSYETFPVNAREAESRRVSRFWQEGHTPGVIEPTETIAGQQVASFSEISGGAEVVHIPQMTINPEFPNTLDLRKNSFAPSL